MAKRNQPAGDGNSTRMQGTIIRKVADRGFCFIQDAEGQDYFCHMSAIEGDGFAQAAQGQAVEFTATHPVKGPRAEDVRLL